MARIQPMGKFRSFVKRAAQQSVSYSTGRYFPGQVIYGVAFVYANRELSNTQPPMLYDNEFPQAIRLIKLTVSEHHKVPNYWDEKGVLDCDGYILLDDNGRRFTNQYPRASYGQTTDTGDRLFSEDFQGDFDERLKREKEDPTSYILVEDMFATISEGVHKLKIAAENMHQPNGFSWEQSREYTELYQRHKSLELLQSLFVSDFKKKFDKIIFAHKHKRFRFWVGKVVDTQEAAYKEQYVPVSSKKALVELANQCKKYAVDKNKRVQAGLYIRISDTASDPKLFVDLITIGGYLKYKLWHCDQAQQISRTYRYSNTAKIKGIDKSGYIQWYSGGDFASNALALKFNSKTKKLREELLKVSGFELKVLFKGLEDSAESFAAYMKAKDLWKNTQEKIGKTARIQEEWWA